MSELVVHCLGAAATRCAAGRLASLLAPGDVVLLIGDLGAGKTTFTQGMAAALGVGDPVTSPTFTLMNIYRTDAGFDLVHVDVYRLERLSEVVDLALPEMIDDGSVVVVEWGERAAAALPGDRLTVRLVAGPGDDERTITFVAEGATWAGRRRELESLLVSR